MADRDESAVTREPRARTEYVILRQHVSGGHRWETVGEASAASDLAHLQQVAEAERT